jgi:hypothetical protein
MLCPAFCLLSPSLAFAFLVSIAASSLSQVWPVTLGGGSARRRTRGHVPVHLPRCCPPPPPREWGSAVTKRSHPSALPPCVFLSAPWKRSFFVKPGEKPYTRARAKLADSCDARHGEAVFFFLQCEGRSGPRALRWARTSPTTTRAEEWCW